MRTIFPGLLLPLLAICAAAALTSCASYKYAEKDRISVPQDPAPACSNPHLVVADLANNRLLFYNSPFTTDESACTVLGQADFTHNSPNQGGSRPTAATMNNPAGMAMDASDHLWVADSNNCRVLEFKPPFTNGMQASVVIGQPDFQTAMSTGAGGICNGGSSPAASGLGWPNWVAIDTHGDVWVVDMGVGRLTEYVPPFRNGMAASVVIGQTSLTDTYQCNGGSVETSGYNPPPPNSTTLCNPSAATFDPQGNLWVADSTNNRVLEYVPPFSTGMAASLQLGNPTNAREDGMPDSITASTFWLPQAVAFDGNGDLWVADTFNRVLEFVPPFSSQMNASLVIGASTFTQMPQYGESDPTAYLLNGPYGMSFDGNGNLLVADGGNSRVLTYVPPFSNGMGATTVIGWPDMSGTSRSLGGANCAAAAPNTLCWPEGGLLRF